MRNAREIQVYDHRPSTPLEQCLMMWVDSYRYADLDIGCSSSSRFLSSDAPPCSDDAPPCSDHLYSRMDGKIAEAVDAEVGSLPPLLRIAIWKSRGIIDVWKFQSLDFEKLVVDAERELENKLKKNLATRIFFV